MVEVSVNLDRAVFEPKGWHKLWAFRRRIEVPLAHIREVRQDPVVAARWWTGLRLPGTQMPGVIKAGSYLEKGGWAFWDVCDPSRAVVVELAGERYRRLVVEVDSPVATVSMLSSLAQGRR